MKKVFATLFVLFLGTSFSHAQLLTLGIKGGASFTNYSGTSIGNIETSAITNYHGGLIAELKVFDNFAIQPELLYSTQGAKLKYLSDEIKNELGYLSLPVMAKFYLTSNGLSLEFGPQASVLVSERNKVNTNDTNTFELGMAGGLSYKLTKSIFVSGRYVAGLTEAKKDAEVKNSVVQFSVGLMF